MSKASPIGVAMIICDQIMTEDITHKKSLLGCFNNVNATQFPATPMNCAIFVALTNGHGSYQSTLKCVNEDEGNETVFQLSGPVNFVSPLQTIEMGFKLVNLSFPKPGIHAITFSCDDVPILHRRITVKLLPPNEVMS
jgi:hypothetical protein